MNATLCATLLTIFPVLYLVFLVETRAVGSSYRKKNPYTWSVGIGTPLSFFGVAITAVGVQTNGLTGFWGGAAWFLFVGAMISLGTVSGLVILTWDREDGRRSFLFGRLSSGNTSGNSNPSSGQQTAGAANSNGGGTV